MPIGIMTLNLPAGACFSQAGRADVLYVYFDEPKQAEGIDIGNGTIIRIDTTTNEVVGFTIINPIKRTLDQLEVQ